MRDLSKLSDADKLFRLTIGIKMVISETTDANTAAQLQNMLTQLGLK